MGERVVFAGFGAGDPQPGTIIARDGRSAAWMAAGYAIASGSEGSTGRSPANRQHPGSSLASLVAGLLPVGSLLCVEEGPLAQAARNACGYRPDVMIVSGSDRGCAVALAIGAKAHSPSSTVVALCDAASMAIGGGDLETAGRANLPVAVVVANDATDPAPYEVLAALGGGHGEVVADHLKMELHLRNALAATMPAVVNVLVNAPRKASVARIF